MYLLTFHECVSQCVQILNKYIRILDLVECRDDINRNTAKMHFDLVRGIHRTVATLRKHTNHIQFDMLIEVQTKIADFMTI